MFGKKKLKTYEELYKNMKQMYPKLDFSNEVVQTLESIWKKFKKNYKQNKLFNLDFLF